MSLCELGFIWSILISSQQSECGGSSQPTWCWAPIRNPGCRGLIGCSGPVVFSRDGLLCGLIVPRVGCVPSRVPIRVPRTLGGGREWIVSWAGLSTSASPDSTLWLCGCAVLGYPTTCPVMCLFVERWQAHRIEAGHSRTLQVNPECWPRVIVPPFEGGLRISGEKRCVTLLLVNTKKVFF